MPAPHDPILVIDSGLGGLTVARAIHERLPHESILYYGDTARLPYGSKTPETITYFLRQIIRHALPRRPKQVVIACNTASALSLSQLKREFVGLSICGVIEPGARAVAAAAGDALTPTIGVIATESTVQSGAYQQAIRKRRLHARVLLRPTPLLVPAIEEGRGSDDPVMRLLLSQYLQPMIDRGLDVLLLGCTHYPLVKRAIRQFVGPGVKVIDSSRACAEDVARRLTHAGLLAAGAAARPVGRQRHFGGPGLHDAEVSRGGVGLTRPTLGGAIDALAALDADGGYDTSTWRGEWFQAVVSDHPERFATLASRFLGQPVELPDRVSCETLAAGLPDVPRLRVSA